MRKFAAALLLVFLAGCISSTSPAPPSRTTIIVPQNPTSTCPSTAPAACE